MDMECQYCGRRWNDVRGLRKHQPSCLKQYLTRRLPPRAPSPTALVADDIVDHNEDINMLDPLPIADPPPPPIPEPPAITASGRPARQRKKTWKLIEAEMQPPRLPPVETVHEQTHAEDDPEPPILQAIRTSPNAMGVYRIYPQRPTHNPDLFISFSELAEENTDSNVPPAAPIPSATQPPKEANQQPWSPFLSSTVARLMSWFHSGSDKKSKAELDSLVTEVLLKDDFDPAELKGFSTTREHNRVDSYLNTTPPDTPGPATHPFPPALGWERRSVTLALPAPKVKQTEASAPIFEVKDIHIRPLLSVMKEAFQGPEFNSLHLTPFEERWDPDHQHEELASPTQPAIYIPEEPFSDISNGHQRLYGEVYTTRKMMQIHRSLPTHPTLETVVVAFMFWSDSTQLANFGTASLWPLYTFFGNCSKYLRAKPTSGHCHHQAYIPSLPDSINDFYVSAHGQPLRSAYITYLKRELMHAVWRLLLTPEFIHAYIHGIIVRCFDTIERLLFPRFFTYGADYPEKVLLALIKYLGGCPCPRCFIAKANIRLLGQKRDMAARTRADRKRYDLPELHEKINTTRKYIFNGFLPNGTKIDAILKKWSLVPNRNAFSVLQPHGLNFYELFVPDLLHEFELGVWKAIFTHLIRILHEIGAAQVAKLNQRYRGVPTFGRDIIRRFHSDAASMKKLAARDFEDLLQCSLPVFEGLLPDHKDKLLSDLLFVLAQWHSLAKLRLQTDSTLDLLHTATAELGAQIRKFDEHVCSQYSTKDLPREIEARARRRQRKSGPNKGQTQETTIPQVRTLNLTTYKLHALGDYVETIRDLGTSESWSTQVGELEHRYVKRLYARTNKNNYTRQIAVHEQRQRILKSVKKRMNELDQPISEYPEPEPKLNLHHYISPSRQVSLSLSGYLTSNQNDLAFRNFLSKLKAHLLGRLLGMEYDGDEHHFTNDQLLEVVIVNDRLYTHKVLRVHYTSYDARRCYDSLNPRTNSDFITPSHEDDEDGHPFWYGRILQIFHAVIYHPRLEAPQPMEFLWVRWFGRDLGFNAGFSHKRLIRLGFVSLDEDAAVSFLDPTEVIRAVHLIPAFHHGFTHVDEPSITADNSESKSGGKWAMYYVGMFSDRDTMMRHLGGSVGHHNSVSMPQAYELAAEDSDDDHSNAGDTQYLPEDDPHEMVVPEDASETDDEVSEDSDFSGNECSVGSENEVDLDDEPDLDNDTLVSVNEW